VVVVIYASTVLAVKLAQTFAGRRSPIVSWLHFSSYLKQRTWFLKFATAHVCISTEIAQAVHDKANVPESRIRRVANGVELSEAAQVARSPSDLRILHVGRLMVGGQKRTDDLLHALKGIEGEWRLDIVGDGEDRPKLQSLAEDLGISGNVTWHGWRKQPWRAADAADILVLCSEFEGFPMALIEAAARGIAIVSTDCPSGPSEIVRPGVNGWLYAVGDIEGLRRRLQHLVIHRQHLPGSAQVRGSVARFDMPDVYSDFKGALESAVRQYRTEVKSG
jgi:UDP-D-galactose:(glucosyl)LPS alpha-1,6-D-galactosyltransferase